MPLLGLLALLPLRYQARLRLSVFVFFEPLPQPPHGDGRQDLGGKLSLVRRRSGPGPGPRLVRGVVFGGGGGGSRATLGVLLVSLLLARARAWAGLIFGLRVRLRLVQAEAQVHPPAALHELRHDHAPAVGLSCVHLALQLLGRRAPAANLTLDVYSYPGASPTFMRSCFRTLLPAASAGAGPRISSLKSPIHARAIASRLSAAVARASHASARARASCASRTTPSNAPYRRSSVSAFSFQFAAAVDADARSLSSAVTFSLRDAISFVIFVFPAWFFSIASMRAVPTATSSGAVFSLSLFSVFSARSTAALARSTAAAASSLARAVSSLARAASPRAHASSSRSVTVRRAPSSRCLFAL